MARLESGSPFAAGGLVLASGISSAAAALGAEAIPTPLPSLPLSGGLLIAGAGAGILFSAWERRRIRAQLDQAQEQSQRAQAQRDVALLQARRMRAQAEGLALMREIHRSTAIPERRERLHRILTLLADLFEAREVSLFAAFGNARPSVLPAACLRITNKEELFVAFESEEFLRAPAGAFPDEPGPAEKLAALHVVRGSATIAREGCQLYIEGTLAHGNDPVAKAQWRRGAQTALDPISTQEPLDILESALAKIDYSGAACAWAAQALERRRTIRKEHRAPSQSGTTDGLILGVPLLANQRPVGVLRIWRARQGFSSPEEEALEEMLIESAKHIALALKKDEDDRKAITDGLTSLYIKRHFLVKLEHFRAETAASGSGFCLILCDIDHFKKVNDTFGHLAGDRVLQGVAGVLRAGLRSGDMAFRYGGEELALLLPRAALEAAQQTAERLRAAVQEARFTSEKGERVPVTISLGVAQHQPGLTGEALIGRADRALYFCKQNGRNRAVCWSPELSAAHTPALA